MTKTLKNKVFKTLENVALSLPGERGCSYFWGEIEVPECLKKEIEKEKLESEE